MEKRRRLISSGLPVTQFTAIVLSLTCVLLFWRYSGCPGPPPEVPVMPSSASFLLVLPGNVSHFPPPYQRQILHHNDLKKLIDLQSFQFLINNESFCNGTDQMLVVVLVHSAPENSHKRAAIRSTWASALKVVFLLGQTSNEKLQEEISQENNSYKDLVVGNFVDSYRNMTYKHVMALKWAIYFCPNSRYILKTDDDVFVNPAGLLRFLQHDLSPLGARQLLYCQIVAYSTVRRSFRSKWRVSHSEYPHRMYPPHCLGWAVLYSPDVVFKLYLESQKARYFWIDDVFVTGLMAARAHVPRSDLGSLVLDRDRYAVLSKMGKDSFVFGPPNLDISEIYEIWSWLHKKAV